MALVYFSQMRHGISFSGVILISLDWGKTVFEYLVVSMENYKKEKTDPNLLSKK